MAAKAVYKFQVNFEKVFVEGILAGKRYHDHLRFCTRADALLFAKRDGSIITTCCGTGAYRQEHSKVIDLAKFA